MTIMTKLPWWARLGPVPEVADGELHERLTRGETLQIVDVRTRREFHHGHLAGAINVPIQSLRRDLPALRLDPSRSVITICKTAHRSIPATRLLRSAGFDAAQLANGTDDWRRQGLPVQKD
jgi:rhodanese-related sulfurtransferase